MATGAAFASIAIVRTPARAAQFDYKFSSDITADHPLNVRVAEAFAAVSKDTNGRFTVKMFPNNQLGGADATFTQLRSGAIDLLALPGVTLSSVIPVATIENVAFAFRDRAAAFTALDGGVGKLIRDQIDAHDMHAFAQPWESGFRQVTANRPIRVSDDFNGLKIRVAGGKIRVDVFQTLGATPTSIAGNEVYTALQTHVVDACESPLVNIELQHFYEVQKYCSLSNLMWSSYWIVANAGAWKALPPGIQRALEVRLGEAAMRARRDAVVQGAALQDKLARQGLQFAQMDTANVKAKLGPYYARWHREFGDAAWSTLEQYSGTLA